MQHRAKKRFGQNFLVDTNIIDHIIDSINPEAGELMIEIGPGLGAMTKPLLSHLDRLNVIELDRDIIPILTRNCTLANHDNKDKLIVNEADVLKFDFAAFHAEQLKNHDYPADTRLRVVGNLPYNISTPVLFHLLKTRHLIKDMHFMLQKEVVDRIVSAPGNKHYGRLSVMLQAYCSAHFLFEVPPHAFQPAPKVNSAILRLVPGTPFESQIDVFSDFEKLVRQAFSQRRKTLKNTLKNICSADRIEQAGLKKSQRAEELSIADFVSLYRSIYKNS
mgnify:FL=1